MAENKAGPFKPEALLRLFYVFAAIICLAAIVVLLWNRFDWATWQFTKLAADKVSVSPSDMLGTEITLSGITVPLAISYLLSKSKELQISISDHTAFYLKSNGIVVEQFNQACLVFADKNNTLKANEAITCLEEFLGLGSHEEDEEISEASQKWLLPTDYLKNGYVRYFQSSDDRKIVTSCIWVVAVPAFCLLIDMYVRFFGINNVIVDVIELTLLIFTAMANFLTYYVILTIVKVRNDIRKQSKHELKKVCALAKPEVQRALQHATAASKAEFQRVTRLLDKLNETK